MPKSCEILVVTFGTPPKDIAEKFGSFFDFFTRKINVPEHLALSLTEVFADEFLNVVDSAHKRYGGVVLSGSAAMIDENPAWLADSLSAIKKLMNDNTPILAVCFGHQLLAYANGSTVGPNPSGLSMGCAEVSLLGESDPLFSTMPTSFYAQVSHRDVVLKPAPSLTVLGQAAHDQHHVYRIGDHFWGVQYHPEWSDGVSLAYCEERHDRLAAQYSEETIKEIKRNIRPTPEGAQLLRTFYQYCADNSEV